MTVKGFQTAIGYKVSATAMVTVAGHAPHLLSQAVSEGFPCTVSWSCHKGPVIKTLWLCPQETQTRGGKHTWVRARRCLNLGIWIHSRVSDYHVTVCPVLLGCDQSPSDTESSTPLGPESSDWSPWFKSLTSAPAIPHLTFSTLPAAFKSLPSHSSSHTTDCSRGMLLMESAVRALKWVPSFRLLYHSVSSGMRTTHRGHVSYNSVKLFIALLILGTIPIHDYL